MTLDEIRVALKGALLTAPVVVIGAAPRQLHDDLHRAGEAMVAVNGGISSCPPGLVDVWIANSRPYPFESWGPNKRRLASVMLAQGAHKHVRLLVLLTRGDGAGAATRKILAKQGTTYDRAIEVCETCRTQIETRAGARTGDMTKHALSAGLTAAALCFFADVPQVRLARFSWTGGYAYLPKEHFTTRGHEAGDKRALRLLTARYGTRFEHCLSLPTKGSEPMGQPKGRAPAASHATASGDDVSERRGPLKVQTSKLCFYGNARRRPGDIFTLRDAKHLKKYMKPIDALAPERSTPTADSRRQEHGQIMRGRSPQLQPNADDPVPEPDPADPAAAEPDPVSPIAEP